MIAGKTLFAAGLAAVLALATGNAGAQLAPRIIGGTAMDPAAVPPGVGALVWSDSMSNFDGERCTATLVAANWVLTAAHCVDGLVTTDLQAVFGETSLSGTATNRYDIDGIVLHSAWDPTMLDNDIAMVHLTVAPPYTTVALASAATVTGLALESNVTAMGWGAIDNNYTYVPDIYSVVLHFISQTACDAGAYYPFPITAEKICAADTSVGSNPPLIDGGSGACFGDSGGPLFSGTTQIGIASFVSSTGCAEPGYPTVYANVGYFDTWIAGVQTNPDISVSLEPTNTLNSDNTQIINLVVSNLNPVNGAGAFTVTLTTSAGVTIVNLDVLNGATCDPVAGTCPITGLAAGASITLPLSVKRSANGIADTVTASVAYTGDYNPDNDTDTTSWSKNPLTSVFQQSGHGGGSLPVGVLLLTSLLALRRRTR